MWYKVYRYMKDHLIVKLAIIVTFLMFGVYLLLTPMQSFFYFLLDTYYYTNGNLERIQSDYRENLQDYINTHAISSDDAKAIYEWNCENPIVTAAITDGTYIVYYSYANINNTITTLTDYNNSYKMKELVSNHSELEDITYHEISFADGITLYVNLTYYGQYTYYLGCYYMSVFVCFFIFLIPLLLFLRVKTKYVHTLAKELRILEGGDLNYPVTEKGTDEIYQLSHGINQMRLSILEKQDQAIHNDIANRKLVTSLSHDLRTPLTSLIGYMEILKQHKYKDEAQLNDFITKSQEKAFQIKDMSDRLFEYFLVSQKVSEEYHMERISISDLLEGLKDNQIFDMINQDYTIKTEFPDLDSLGFCMMDVEFMQRVLDNILSNVRKYADKSTPIIIRAIESNQTFSLVFENGVRLSTVPSESTGIGLKTCEKIMEEHHGTLEADLHGSSFITKLTLPYQ